MTVVEAAAAPGGRAGIARTRRVPLRHRADRADDAPPDRRLLRRGRRRRWPTCSRCARSIRCTGRASPTAASCVSATAARRWTRGDPRACADRARRRRSARSATGSRELYDLEMPNFIERNFDSPLDLAPPLAPGARRSSRLGAFRRLGPGVGRYFDDERLRRLFSFQSMYAGLAPYEALAIYAVITYMDTVQRRVRAPTAACTPLPRGARRRGGGRRRDVPLRHPGRADPARATARPARSRACGSPAARSIAADVVVANPDLPVAYRTLLPGPRAPPRGRAAGRYSPSAVVWHVGVPRRAAARRRPPQHPLRRSEWDESFRALLDDGTRMPDPSLLVTRADARRAVDGAARPRTCCTSSNRCPNLDGRVDWTTRARAVPRATWSSAVASARLPDRRRGRGRSSTRSTGRRRGMERGTPFALSHRFLQTRSVPARQPRATGARAWCSSAPAPCPASACRWCWSRAMLAARAASTRLDVGSIDDRSRSRSRYAACRELNQRYGTTYYWATFAAAAGEAPPRVGAVRASAATPTTSSTTSGRRPSSVRAQALDGLRRPLLRRPRRRVAPTTRC